MRSKLVLASCILTFFFFSSAATAAVIAEIGDAGDALATAQDTTGMGTVNGITGVLGSGDVDLYRIYINDPSLFLATTVGSSFDTQLFLFDAAGLGVAANDDCPGGCGLQSSLDPGNALYSGLAAGDYYLGVSGFNNDPVDGSNAEIFAETAFNAIEAPSSANPLAGWQGGGQSGDYVITLRGVGNNPIPEPSAALLYLAGFGAVGGRLRRRGRKG